MTMQQIVTNLSKALPPIHAIYVNQQNETNYLSFLGSSHNFTTNKNNENHENIHNHNNMMMMMQNECYLKKPVGIHVFDYKRQVKSQSNTNKTANHNSEESSFVICLGNGSDINVSKYHDKIQSLALWFIENADNVDLSSDEGGGSWKVLYLFRKHYHNHRQLGGASTIQYSLVGYVTLFAFNAPFHKPKGGIILRICQVLILPLYQRCGHGKILIRAVYDYAHGRMNKVINQNINSNSHNQKNYDEEIVQVNVEDPAPSFEALRNCIDYEIFHENYNQNSTNCDEDDDNDVKEQKSDHLFLPLRHYQDDCFEPIPDNIANHAASKAKISKVQIQIAYEIYKFAARNRLIEAVKHQQEKQQQQNDVSKGTTNGAVESSEIIEAIEKDYRLMVKRRLNQFYREDLGACATKEEKKQKLANLFEMTLAQYEKIGI